MIGNGRTADFFHDAWLFDLPLSRGPNFISSKAGKSIRIFDLIQPEESGWRYDRVAQVFRPKLVDRVLSIVVSTHSVEDVRVWRFFYGQRVGAGDL